MCTGFVNTDSHILCLIHANLVMLEIKPDFFFLCAELGLFLFFSNPGTVKKREFSTRCKMTFKKSGKHDYLLMKEKKKHCKHSLSSIKYISQEENWLR